MEEKIKILIKKVRDIIKHQRDASVYPVKIRIFYKYPVIGVSTEKSAKSHLILARFYYKYGKSSHWVQAIIDAKTNKLYFIYCCNTDKDYFEKLAKEVGLKFVNLGEIEIDLDFLEKVKIENPDDVEAKAAYFFIKEGLVSDLYSVPPPIPKELKVELKEKSGKYYLIGTTFPYRDVIKNLGGKWDWRRKVWYFEDKDLAQKCFQELLERIDKDHKNALQEYRVKMEEYEKTVRELEKMIAKEKIEEIHKFIIAYDLPSENLKGIDPVARQFIRNTRVKATYKLQLLGLQSTQSVILSSKDLKTIEKTVDEVMKLYDQLNSALRGKFDFAIGRPLIKVIEITQTQFLSFKDLAEKQIRERFEKLIDNLTEKLGELDLIVDQAKKSKMIKNFKQQKRSIDQAYELARELGIDIEKQYKLVSEMIETAIEVLGGK